VSKGLDANQDLSAHAACLAKAGFGFACRYIKRLPSALTHAEAVALSAAGLSVVSVVEIGSPTSVAHFSQARGLEDGAFAYAYARDHLKQPTSAPIYFAADFDATPADIQGPINAYFMGVTAAFEKNGFGSPAYPIGVYGSGATCAWLLKNTAVTYAWLAMSRGWRGSKTFSGWNIRQLVGETVCGVSVDTDESRGHGGGFQVHA
jgi:hypothetical protein